MNNEDLVNKWLYFVGLDIQTIDLCLNTYPVPNEVILFHSQQAVEKVLKAVLVANGIDDIPKTHDLAALCEKCKQIDSLFVQFKSDCNTLKMYAYVGRYPDYTIEITEENARYAAEKAKNIVDKITDYLKKI